ncbi:MAG TPA: argininosuccinate lyase [Candidatus Angelobacter sp.]|nr:argininosuccinate lyase [Candidatus Angelobacter sp.]
MKNGHTNGVLYEVESQELTDPVNGHAAISAGNQIDELPAMAELVITTEVSGRLTRAPNPALFELLYEQQAVRDHVEVLPYLLRIDAAHVVMLARAKLLPVKVAGGLLRVNQELKMLLDEGKEVIPLQPQHRGLYSLYEQEYVRRLGKQVGGAAHMARSRNDINATVTRLRLRDELLELLSEFCKLSHVVTEAAEKYSDAAMCGFTHLQPAQPSTLGHYLVGVLAELTRSAEALDRAFAIADSCPMGAAAGFGTSFAIDRGQVAEFLGFSAIIQNSTDAVASRDYLVHILSGMAMLGMTLTRFATDFQAWAGAGYGFLGWPDDLVSTSSIMPQKRNAFVLENIRGEAIRPLGCLVNTLAGMKNVSFSNSVEISSEAATHIWPAMKALLQAIQLVRLLVENLEVHTERMLEFLAEANTTMTAVADLLVSDYGISFRMAHDSVSRLVNCYPVMPPVADIKSALERIVFEVADVSLTLDMSALALALDPVACARAAVFGGGPSSVAVRAQIHSLVGRAGAIERQVKIRRQCQRDADSNLQIAADEIVHAKPDVAHNGKALAGYEKPKAQVKAVGMGQCPLVLGEVVQGKTKDHQHFLITAPIGLFSWAEFVRNYDDDRLTVEPAICSKSLEAVQAYLQEQGLPQTGILRVVTPVGSGQGFGTSTADITASLRAVASAWNRTISPEAIARIAVAIEPSDGSMYSGCVAFAHLDGVLLETLGPLPRFESLVICTGGVIDTLAFNERRKYFSYSERDESQLMMAWKMVRHANQTGDASLLARAATVSSRINERFLPKPYFKETAQFIEMGGADGMMVAHSGTALALIFDPSRSDFQVRLTEAKRFLSNLQPPAWFEISNRMTYQRVIVKHVSPLPHLSPPSQPAGRMVGAAA